MVTFYLPAMPGLLSSDGLRRRLLGLRLGVPRQDSAPQGPQDVALALVPFPPLFLLDSKKLPVSGAWWRSVWLEFSRRFPTGAEQVK